MIPALILVAAVLWRSGMDTSQIASQPLFWELQISEAEIYKHIDAIKLLARSLVEPMRMSA